MFLFNSMNVREEGDGKGERERGRERDRKTERDTQREICVKIEVAVLGRTVSVDVKQHQSCLLYTSPSPRDMYKSRMPSSA